MKLKFFKVLLRMVKLISFRYIEEFLTIQISKQYISSNSAILYKSTSIINLQKNRNSIMIGKGSMIMGELYVFKFGGKISIGEYCFIGENSKIWSADNIIIGNNVLISHNVNIMDTNAHELNHIKRADRYTSLIQEGPWSNKGNIITKPIIINDNVWVGFNAVILKGVTVGEGAIIAAASVVTKNVPPFTIVAGNPATIVKKLPDHQ